MNAAPRTLPSLPVSGLALLAAMIAPAALYGCASGSHRAVDASTPLSDGSGDSGDVDGSLDAPLRVCASDPDCDDGDACNGLELCVASACALGTPIDCDDGVSCTNDTCESTSGACTHSPDDALCPADLACDVVDDCTAPLACTVDADCDDAVFCNGIETCDPAFGCRHGTPPTCDDLLRCTTDTCDAATDACLHTNDDTQCRDTLACNGIEACDPTNPSADGDGCVFGASPVCDDGIPCTIDGCSEAAGGCAVTPDDTICSDGVFCNGAEICDATAGCGPGVTPTCADTIGCTTGRCDATTDACVQDPDDAFCQDGLVCNGAERCDVTGTTPGRGCVAGAPMNCSDGLACTTDGCTEPGTCTHGGSDADSDGYQAIGCGTGADCNDLVAAIHPGATELCDGLDNDCSGGIDNGAGMTCALGSAARACTTTCGSAGTQPCSAACTLGACVASTETCNDCDDNGNGSIDEGLACRRGTTTSCSTSCGTAGSRTCAADCSGYSACVAPTELCNDCDDNGNGLVDDGLTCRRGTSAACTTTCGTSGTKVCAIDCSAYGTCRAATETCNGCDDDADGTIDNGFACRLGQTTSCMTLCGTAGVRSCASDCSAYGACVATEVCNGCDDNGNGVADEGFACASGTSRSCSTGCGTTGTQTCNATCGGYGTCTAAEVCNGCDDDADGSADEDFACRQGATQSCTVCGGAGTRTCNATCSGLGACTAAEVCNGCDDDADGTIDNGFACASGTSRSCSTGCGTTGTQACNASCGGYSACAATEVCNGCDDNGNGVADDGFACVLGASRACTTACGTAGNQSCNGACSAYSTCYATTETCGNGCDDNGNGSIDEGCVVAPPNDLCPGAIAYTIGSTVSGTTVGATNDYTSSCGGASASPDVVYAFTSTGSATSYRIHVDTTSHDGTIHVHSANTCAAGDEVACNDDFGTTRASEVTLNNLAAGTYYIVVDGFSSGNAGPFTLTSSSTPLSGDLCPGLAITANGTYVGTTVGQGANYTASCGYLTDTSPDVVYSITARTTGSITVAACGSGFDTVVYVDTACGASATICNDDFCGLQSSVTFSTTAGTTYYVVMDGYNGQSGAYTLAVSGY